MMQSCFKSVDREQALKVLNYPYPILDRRGWNNSALRYNPRPSATKKKICKDI